MIEGEEKRMERTRRFYGISTALFLILSVYLIWALQDIILPVVIGLIAAYISLPALNLLYRNGFSKSFSIFLLVFGFLLAIAITIFAAYNIIPNEDEMLEMRLGLQYNIQNKYESVMGLEESQNGNVIYTLLGSKTDELIENVTCFLSLNENEKDRLRAFQQSGDLENLMSLQYLNKQEDISCDEERTQYRSYIGSVLSEDENQTAFISAFFNMLSIWVIMPFVFISTLLDGGKTRRKFIQLIPNAYFEMTLTTLNNIDKAIGTYLRCMFSNILIVGSMYIVSLKIIGFGYTSSLVIGALGGLLNAIPLIGSVIALFVIMIYALLIHSPDTFLPFITQQNMILWSLIVFLIIQIIDNTIFKPFLMGKAINLNPVVVIITAVGGAIIAGFIGMILAIPVVLILKVGFTTLREEMKRYFFIY